jgi:hypothetical protein
VAGLFMSACNQQPENVKMYFNFDSLVNMQLEHLVRKNAVIEKKAVMGIHKDDSVFTPDSITWENELEIFRHLDVINKPVNTRIYVIKDGIADDRSNLTIRTYQATRNAQVRELKFYYQDTFDKLRKIEAVTNEFTTLYSNTRNLSMEFDQINSQVLLSRYAIEGRQKMILSDSVHFRVDVKVVLP